VTSISKDSSVVVMPTAHRPEVLAWSLQRLARAKNVPSVKIYLDRVGLHRLDEVEYVRDRYYPLADIHYAAEHPACTSGTWNILNSMKAGYDTGAEHVFIVEEDVMMTPNFMERHQQVFDSGDYLATCGRRIPAFFERYGDLYTNPGSCLTRELLSHVIPHINDRYFQDTGGYIRKTFGHEPFNSSLDDGLIRMVVRELGGKCGYPDTPICAHQGFTWYDEIDIYSNHEGTLQERIDKFGVIAATTKPTDRYAGDFEPFNPF
jgi:hypothetical protein